MSDVPSNVLCIAGCGSYGDPLEGFICLACRENRALEHELVKHQRQKKARPVDVDVVKVSTIDQLQQGLTTSADVLSKTKQALLKNTKTLINATFLRDHEDESVCRESKLMKNFYARPREKLGGVSKNTKKEITSFEAQQAEWHLAKDKLRRYMIHSNMGEETNVETWLKYQYGCPSQICTPVSESSTSVLGAAKAKVKHALFNHNSESDKK